VLDTLQVDPTSDNKEQMSILIEAFAIYLEREATRGGVWKNSGAKGMAFQLMSKAERSFHLTMTEQSQAVQDEALDCINYAAFLLRQLRADDYNGRWQWHER
jgi:hypothetical protein